MTAHIKGPLYYEALGPRDAPPMLFVHPNPMDSCSWLYQLGHFSTWFRCIAVDLPGYGRSPASEDGLTMPDLADACWEVIDRESPAPVVLVGCSTGSYVSQHMYHRRPDQVRAVILCGAGWRAAKSFPGRRIADYQSHGIGFRRQYTLQDFSAAYRDSELAAWFAQLFTERNGAADLESIIRTFQAVAPPDPRWLQAELAAPVLIVSGTEDPTGEAAPALRERLPDAELVRIAGAGHACHIEQPWQFDAEVLAFLRRRGILPGAQSAWRRDQLDPVPGQVPGGPGRWPDREGSETKM